MSRKLFFVLCLFADAAACLGSPVGVGLRMEHRQLLKFEPATVYVRIENRLSERIAVGPAAGQARVEIEIEDESGRGAERIRAAPIVPAMDLAGGENRVLRLDLAHWYDLSATGRYLARVAVDWKAKRYVSGGAAFDVVPGMELARMKRYLPGYDDLERIYSVRYLARGGAEEAFLSVDERPSGLNYGVFHLGGIIRIFKPTVEVDTRGRVIVTHQSRPYCFTRTVFFAARNRVYRVDQTYHLPDGRPYPFEGGTNAPAQPAGE